MQEAQRRDVQLKVRDDSGPGRRAAAGEPAPASGGEAPPENIDAAVPNVMHNSMERSDIAVY
jgi:hypothetical protein